MRERRKPPGRQRFPWQTVRMTEHRTILHPDGRSYWYCSCGDSGHARGRTRLARLWHARAHRRTTKSAPPPKR